MAPGGDWGGGETWGGGQASQRITGRGAPILFFSFHFISGFDPYMYK